MRRSRRDHPSSEPFDGFFTKEDLKRFAESRKGPNDIRFYVVIDRYYARKRDPFYVVRWFDPRRNTWRAERLHRDYNDVMDWAWWKANKLSPRHLVLARFSS